MSQVSGINMGDVPQVGSVGFPGPKGEVGDVNPQMPILAAEAAASRDAAAISAATATTKAGEAADSAAAAALFDGPWLDDVAALLADTALVYGPGASGVAAGDIVRTRAEGFSYEVAASGATIITAVNTSGYHIATAGGVKLFALPDGAGRISAAQLGVVADGVSNWETNFAARMIALYTLSAQPGLCVVWPGGDYATSMNLGSTHSGSRMHFDGAVFYGILHLIDNIDGVIWTGDVSSYDRLGLQGCTNAILPEKIRMLNDPAKNTATLGVGNRGVHFLTASNIEWGQIIVDDTAPTQAALPGSQRVWAAFAVQSQGLRGFRGSVLVKNASGHGCYINALDIDIDIQVDGYGKSAIDYAATALEGTDSEAQSEQGCGVWLNRCTGRVGLQVDQSNASPLGDKYSVLIDETGLSSVAASRHQPLRVTKLVASVGNGNRGVCVGEGTTPSVVCNVAIECSPFVTMRASAATLEAGYSGFGVRAPSTASSSYRRLSANRNIEFSGFTTQTCFLALAATGTDVYTELDIEGIFTRSMGAGRFVQIDGTGGALHGRIGSVSGYYAAGSSAVPFLDVDSCEGFAIESGRLVSGSVVTTRAVRFIGNVDSRISIPVIYNFGRTSPDGGFLMENLTRCKVSNVFMDRVSVSNVGFLFAGALTDCVFEGLQATNFADGFSVVGTPTFTGCVAIRCKATGNTDDTDVTLAMFPAANQLACTNFAT